MTLLTDVLDPAELATAVENGHVRTQRHPARPYVIYNYTEACQYAGAWTPVTLACRGLIVAGDTVLARPLPKFFNHDQPQAPALAANAEVLVTDKADGCFPRQTPLNLWGGGAITIAEVVRERLSVTLVGMNAEGDLVPATVTDWHDNGRKDHWLDIEVDAPVSRRSGAAGRPNRLRVTVNHHIYVNGEYRAACEVRPGDTLITQTWEPAPDIAHIAGVPRSPVPAEMPVGREVVRPRKARVIAVTPVAPTKRNFPGGRTGYDISTSTHNYLARGVLVHNSLGIVYPDRNKLAIATRGSFTSDQARHATEVLRSRYPEFVPPTGLTVLVKIVYPANRIVLDYGGLDDLILLGAVEIATGRTFGPAAVPQWPGPVVDSFAYATLAEALAAPPRAGREGLVVHFTGTDQRVKIKYTEYVRLHRLVTGLSARTVWEVLVSGGDLDALTEPLPDEFHAWVTGVAAELTGRVEALATAVEAEFAAIVAGLPRGWGRREFAARAVRSEHRGALFLRLDDKDYRPGLWQLARPAGDQTPTGTQVSEE